MNLFFFVDNNPIYHVDVLGLYNFIFWRFSPAEESKVRGAISNVAQRLPELIEDMKTYERLIKRRHCGPCWDELRSNLLKLKDLFATMRYNLQSGVPFAIRQRDFGNDDSDAYVRLPHVLGYDVISMEGATGPMWFNMHPSADWRKRSSSEFNRLVFHEFTHTAGTDDGESGNEWNDAHSIDKFMNARVTNVPIYVLAVKLCLIKDRINKANVK